MTQAPTPPADSGEAKSNELYKAIEAPLLAKIKFIDENEHIYLGSPHELIQDLEAAVTAYAANQTRTALQGLREQKLAFFIEDATNGDYETHAVPVSAVDAAIERLGR